MKSKRILKNSLRPRLQQKMKWQHVAVGIALAAVLVAAGVFVYLNLGNSHKTMAATKSIVYSKSNGKWLDATTWDPAVPKAGDSIVLKSGHIINISETVTLDANKMAVYGNIIIENGKKLTLTNGSVIAVHKPGGTIDGGLVAGDTKNSAGSKITYNNKAIWDSKEGTITGPSILDEAGYRQMGLLPIKLAYFKAKAESGKVTTEWATIKEENNDFFTIERSTDGKSFQVVGTLPGAGNSNTELSYSFIDESPLSGTSYYRLKQTDYDGKFEYFDLVTVKNERGAVNGFPALNVQSVGPNPFINNFYVNFDLTNDGPVEVRLMNMQGHLIVSELVDGFTGSNRYDFNDRQGLKAGTYFLSLVQNNNSSKAIRLIKK